MYTLLADADGPWGGGPWFLLIPLFWLIVVFTVVFVLRRTVWRRRGCDGRGPLGTLGDRYANGDITEDEYRARRAVLLERHDGGGAK
jgi:putative membrane protein